MVFGRIPAAGCLMQRWGFCGDLMERTKSHGAACNLVLHPPFEAQTKPSPKFYSLLCADLLVLPQKAENKGDILHFIHSGGAHSSTGMNEPSVSRFVKEKRGFLRKQLEDL